MRKINSIFYFSILLMRYHNGRDTERISIFPSKLSDLINMHLNNERCY